MFFPCRVNHFEKPVLYSTLPPTKKRSLHGKEEDVFPQEYGAKFIFECIDVA